MKTAEMQSNVLKNAKKVPYADKLQSTADLIANDAQKSLDDGRMGGVEAAGHLSLATLLSAVSEGDIPLAKAYPLLKTIAEKKTPDPVQKIEQRTEIDMRALIVDAVAKNPVALEQNIAIALANREQIRQNVGAADNRLELKPVERAVLPTAGEEEIEESKGLDEFSYELRGMELDDLLRKENDKVRLEGLLGDEAQGYISNGAAPVDKDWFPGSEPTEIARLRKNSS